MYNKIIKFLGHIGEKLFVVSEKNDVSQPSMAVRVLNQNEQQNNSYSESGL